MYHSWRHGIVLGIVLAGGLCASLALDHAVRAWERDRLDALLGSRAAERAQLLQTKVLCSMESLHSIAALIDTQGEVDRKTFRRFVQNALSRQPDVQALGWTPCIPLSRRAEYEAAARADGWPNFQFTQLDKQGRSIPAPDRPEFLPVYYVEPLATNLTALGFELDSDASRRAALQQARDIGSPVATAPVRLVQESDNQLGFVVYLPVYQSATKGAGEGPRKLKGFASAVFRVQDLLRPIVQDLAAEGLDVSVLDHSANDLPLLHIAASEIAQEGRGSAALSVAGRQWRVTLRPTPAFSAAHSSGQSRAILLTGLLVTLLLAAYIYAGLRRTAEIERRVFERTLQLSSEVAERKRAEESAKLAETRFRSIFENSIEGIFQTSPDGRYISANRALAQVYGYDSIEQLISDLTNIAGQLYVEPRRREEFVQKIQRNGAVSEFESQVYRKDGSIIWISENARAARDDNGRVLYYEGTVVDITERKFAEGSLRRNRDELESRVRERTLELAQINEALEAEIAVRKRAEDAAAAANRAKSAFLASMSHEIRTPMNAILGYAQVLERDSTLRASQREALQTVLSSGNHLLDLIDDVLEISKIEAGCVELRAAEFDLNSMVRDVSGMFRQRCRQKSVALIVEDLAEKPTRVIGDERKLRQVLINLMGNAVKFTDRGSITLRVRPEEGDSYRFEVIDTGIGIAPEARGEIFEAFNQGPVDHRRGGSGLGLAISRQHIELMGGHLAVTSSCGVPDSGSTFSFVVPLRCPQRLQADAEYGCKSVVTLASGQVVRAMVVDDVAENRDVLARMLEMAGCEVALAGDGHEALDQLKRQLPDIIFIDILMPGMGGVDLARRIQARFGDQIRLVAASASALAHEQREYLHCGFHAFLAKPVRWERAYDLLATLLGVTFEPAESSHSQLIASPQRLESLGLPNPLRNRLLHAAGQYRITEMKQCIEEIEQLGPDLKTVCDFMKECMRRYDMEAIIENFSPGDPSAPLAPELDNAGVP